jgi:hypothetical protein
MRQCPAAKPGVDHTFKSVAGIDVCTRCKTPWTDTVRGVGGNWQPKKRKRKPLRALSD